MWVQGELYCLLWHWMWTVHLLSMHACMYVCRYVYVYVCVEFWLLLAEISYLYGIKVINKHLKIVRIYLTCSYIQLPVASSTFLFWNIRMLEKEQIFKTRTNSTDMKFWILKPFLYTYFYIHTYFSYGKIVGKFSLYHELSIKPKQWR